MMARMQIALDAELQRRARKRATDLGVSFAEYIRRLVARDLSEPQPVTDPSAVFDLGRSEAADVARSKDEMVARAVAARRSRYGSRS